MHLKAFQFVFPPLAIACMLVFPGVAAGQLPHNTVGSLTVYVRGPGGDPLDQAQVELGSITGQFHQQATTRAGRVTFTSLGGGTFTVTAVAAGYKTTTEQVQLIGGEANTVTVRMLPDSIAPKPEAEAGPPILAPRAKKELGKAVEALRTNRVEEAHDHLETAYRLAPGNPDVNYIYGLYCARVEDWENAKSHLEKVLKLYPKHVGAMISLATLLLRENKTTEAISYYKNAVELEPSSWRAHALLPDALLLSLIRI